MGDLTYEAALMETGTTPGTGDAAVLRASYRNVRRLKERIPDLVIVPSHDFTAAENIKRAMCCATQISAAG